MRNIILHAQNAIEPTSYLWHRLFSENDLPPDGTVIEAAPGYEPKIGNALALYGFHGTLFIIEPDEKAAHQIESSYRHILPKAAVRTVNKSLQEVTIGTDVPYGANALVASHPFDDMVIALIVEKADFFSQEKESEAGMVPDIQKLYEGIHDKEYLKSIQATTATWKFFVQKSGPQYFIISQYPSHTLAVKGLVKRQNSGFAVLEHLKRFYKDSLVKRHYEDSFGFKGDPKWWIVAREPYKTYTVQS